MLTFRISLYTLILLISVGCVSNVPNLKETGIEIDETKIRDKQIETLPKEIALKYINSNFKFTETSKSKNIEEVKKMNQFVNAKDMRAMSEFEMESWKYMEENPGTTDCKFEQDKIYIYANKNIKTKDNRFEREYVGVIPLTYDKINFIVRYNKNRTFRYIGILNSAFTSSSPDVLSYNVYCYLSLRTETNVKKVGSALYSLGIKPFQSNS